MKALILASFSALTLLAVAACEDGSAPQSGAGEQPSDTMTTTPTPDPTTDTAQ